MAALKRSALGRGLDALITMDDLKTGGSSSISEIELSKIQPNPEQPRSVFEEETLEELATSIRSLGVIQPITLKEIGFLKQTFSNFSPFKLASVSALSSLIAAKPAPETA